MKKLCVFLMLLSAVSLGNTVQAADFTIRLAHNHSEEGMYYKGALKFIELVEERSGGKIKVDHYPAGQLGADRDIQEGVQLGTIEAGISSSPVALINDYFKLLDAPYLFVSREHVAKVLDSELGQKIAKPLEEIGIKHLGYWENGFRQITNNVRPINTPEDLAGIKLRTPENPVRMTTFKTLGANPVPMSFKEVFGALQQGVIDGQENPLATIYQASLQEVQKYLSLTGHVYSPTHLLMNKELFDSMPEDLQQILVDAGREVAVYTRQLGAENDARLADVIQEAGVEVNQADVKAFVSKAKPVWQMIIEDCKYDDAAEVLEQFSAMAD
ncbi:C4-dicarboxylate ABC transporter substrate-binding protein [candidate division KSB3 bacterium]|uniref:C4-dicarboxylate ABC transporter substrate-binding protein n=1 Tax=candidate division KSB3 bacterium TaxID=2044937 RepID=A0A2G6E2A1_9BACT|nr:MAG: C4-dicarboxylate ABC transporter substrate-binding protein [candidate division KSB3 bacterium]PIE28478.1 MAG: C4-dicarboxylate ABC transporter substrate-binding protein [candidate division KSB3 bacterium]